MNQQRGFSVGEILVGVLLLFFLGVFALPYFLRGRMTHCRTDAPATIRTLNTSQSTYSLTFPDAGFAPNLSALGGGSSDKGCLGPPPPMLVSSTIFSGVLREWAKHGVLIQTTVIVTTSSAHPSRRQSRTTGSLQHPSTPSRLKLSTVGWIGSFVHLLGNPSA
jgi:hypothetical protein